MGQAKWGWYCMRSAGRECVAKQLQPTPFFHTKTQHPPSVSRPPQQGGPHTNKHRETYSLPGLSGKNPPLACTCTLAHTPLSTVLRRNPRDQNKARLTNGPQAVLTLGSGNRRLTLPLTSWTRPSYWRRYCDFEVLASKNAEETVIAI